MPSHHKGYLRTLGVETKANQTKKLQDELIKKYTEVADVISKQNNFAVLNYINMCHSEGSSEAIHATAMGTIAKEKYKDVFRQSNEIEFIDEDELEDLDFVPSAKCRRGMDA
ncbi:hypothetical protein BG011_003199 [Mortierella polycephala]|uniref:Uncharacterized protein n=1 Tax=Mortierella polycephala TaxID=41804 RepID=A0A9P6PI04_9FUNG|nr:hypothetical protein BG011_003199 [Mortierella polycephala]